MDETAEMVAMERILAEAGRLVGKLKLKLI